MNKTAIKNQSFSEFLLDENDYLILNSGNNKYLFLSDSLRYFEISNPAIEEYLRICKIKNSEETSLTGDEIMTIGNYLKQEKEDEKTFAPELFHNFLILNLTGGCNLSCKYCFADTKNPQTMSLDIAKKAIDNMLSQTAAPDEYSIFFFGGEPLLRKELVEQITEYAYHEATVKRNKKMRFLINTNATLIDDRSCSLFQQYDFKVTVSIDGPMELHDTNRVYINGKGSYERVMESLSLLKEYSISTNLRATFSPKIGSLVSVFDFFEKLELPYAYSFTINTDYKSNAGDTCFDNERFDAIAEELKRVMDYFVSKITNSETIFCTGLIHKLHTVKYRQKKSHACEAGRRSLTVNEQGDYYACQNMLPYKHTGLGNVNVGIDSEARRKFESKELEQLPGCSRCVIRKLCAGGCEVERLNADHKPDSQACKFARIEWEAILYAYSRLMEIKAQRDKKTITQYCN